MPPLIVIHGGPGAPGRDQKALAALNEKYGIPVLLYDQIGCGESTHLRDTKGDTKFWTSELFVAELDNVRQYLQIGAFNLLGHSDGAITAVAYTLTQPRGLRKLIIFSCAASEKLRVQGIRKNRAQLPQDMQKILITCEEDEQIDSPEYKSAWLEFARRHLCRLDPWPPAFVETMTLMSEDDTVTTTMYGPIPLKTVGSRKDHDFVGRLPEITADTVPGGVLLANGRYDMSQDEGMVPYFTQIQARVKWRRFEESSHMAHLEEPQAFLTTIGEFLMTA